MIHDVEGFILIGGQSSRMGADKAGLRLGALTFVERLAGEMRGIGLASIKLVGAHTDSCKEIAELGAKHSLPVVSDIYPQCGALGGLHAALSHTGQTWTFALACDLPFVMGALMQRLTELRAGFEAVVPMQPDGHAQPLCALYNARVCLPQAQQLLEAGERRAHVLAKQVRTRIVFYDEWADLNNASLLSNVNTPHDYQRACEQVDCR